MKIGVLAYGSLISDPGEELSSITVGRKDGVLTPFAVEFARRSGGRKGAPTLVPVDAGGGQVRAVIFTVNVSPQEAADIVYRREINAVGSEKTYKDPAPDAQDAVRIDRIEGLEDYDLVLSTRLSANIDPLSPDMLAEFAIASARELDDGRDGISYLMNAIDDGIVTPLTNAYQAKIIEKLGQPDLKAALAALRAPLQADEAS